MIRSKILHLKTVRLLKEKQLNPCKSLVLESATNNHKLLQSPSTNSESLEASDIAALNHHKLLQSPSANSESFEVRDIAAFNQQKEEREERGQN